MEMNGNFILDTNIVIAFFGNDATVATNIAKGGHHTPKPANYLQRSYPTLQLINDFLKLA